ncbi:transmembrane protein 272-like [Hyperolius riggenbachi]|uniref:transmembrane protein 272-like n=1 Tax=Hyperolius riggenbachi TaxID=752182 RepID=UPI0035A3750D
MEPNQSLGTQILSYIIWMGLSVAMIVMGAIYQHNCPIQPYIPIFLIVMGATHLLACILLFLRPVLGVCIMVLEGFIGLFSLAWFIAGSVWVFKIYKEYEGFCQRDLYLFAFSILIIQYVAIGLSLFCPCLVGSPRAFYERLE